MKPKGVFVEDLILIPAHEFVFEHLTRAQWLKIIELDPHHRGLMETEPGADWSVEAFEVKYQVFLTQPGADTIRMIRASTPSRVTQVNRTMERALLANHIPHIRRRAGMFDPFDL